MKEKATLKAPPADAGYSRLHITPFDPQLLKVIVPAAVLPNARRISYHSIQTFPDKLYGFVDLPVADAVKIKNKLNGATLRGAKIHIEPARPENMPQPIPGAIVASDAAPKSRKSKSDKKDKKRKRDNLEIAGVELEDGRKVKRGWTVTPEEAQAKKKKNRDDEKKRGKSEKKDDKKKKRPRQAPESQYTDGPEALVKTRLPPNKLSDSTGGDRKQSKKHKHREVMVHEFEHNTKFATFLKMTQPTPATGREGASFVEGKGWVKEDGTVLEEVRSTRPRTVPKLQVDSMRAPPQTTEEDVDTSSSSGSSSEDDDLSNTRDTGIVETMPSPSESTNIYSVTEPASTARPKSSGSVRSLTIQIPATPTAAPTKVHPLEALFKRKQPDEAGTPSTQMAPADPELFTFGGGLDDDLEDDEDPGEEVTAKEDGQGSFQGPPLPMTPYSKQDFEWRNTRSAAPTPDTAYPSRISRTWPLGDDDDALDDVQEDREEDGEDGMVAGAGEEAGEGGEEAIDKYKDFEKWFWKNRGHLDRAWKERRRVARKEKRHRDNKARQDRAI